MASHGLENCVPVLRRWAALSERPLPQDWSTFRQANATEAMSIESRDPELVALLAGRASASLRADALTGELPSTPPDTAAQANAERQARVRFLLEQHPWGRPASFGPGGEEIEAALPANFTAQLELSSLDPEAAAREQAKHRTALSTAELMQQQERQRQQEAALRFESLVAGLRR